MRRTGRGPYILNLDSRDVLVKALELTLLAEQVLVVGRLPKRPPQEHGTTQIEGPIEASRGWSHSPALAPSGEATQLSPRERQVLISLAQGEPNKVIARLCQMSEATVKVHLKTILRKTKTQNRTQAAIWAMEHGFRIADLADHHNGVDEILSNQTALFVGDDKASH